MNQKDKNEKDETTDARTEPRKENEETVIPLTKQNHIRSRGK